MLCASRIDPWMCNAPTFGLGIFNIINTDPSLFHPWSWPCSLCSRSWLTEVTVWGLTTQQRWVQAFWQIVRPNTRAVDRHFVAFLGNLGLLFFRVTPTMFRRLLVQTPIDTQTLHCDLKTLEHASPHVVIKFRVWRLSWFLILTALPSIQSCLEPIAQCISLICRESTKHVEAALMNNVRWCASTTLTLGVGVRNLIEAIQCGLVHYDLAQIVARNLPDIQGGPYAHQLVQLFSHPSPSLQSIDSYSARTSNTQMSLSSPGCSLEELSAACYDGLSPIRAFPLRKTACDLSLVTLQLYGPIGWTSKYSVIDERCCT